MNIDKPSGEKCEKDVERFTQLLEEIKNRKRDEILALEISNLTKDQQKINILYKMARLLRNTDGIHPSTGGPLAGKLLMELRTLDGERYDREVISPIKE